MIDNQQRSRIWAKFANMLTCKQVWYLCFSQPPTIRIDQHDSHAKIILPVVLPDTRLGALVLSPVELMDTIRFRHW